MWRRFLCEIYFAEWPHFSAFLLYVWTVVWQVCRIRHRLIQWITHISPAEWKPFSKRLQTSQSATANTSLKGVTLPQRRHSIRNCASGSIKFALSCTRWWSGARHKMKNPAPAAKTRGIAWVYMVGWRGFYSTFPSHRLWVCAANLWQSCGKRVQKKPRIPARNTGQPFLSVEAEQFQVPAPFSFFTYLSRLPRWSHQLALQAWG